MRINRESAESVCKNVIIQEVVLNCQRKLFLFAFGCFHCLANIYEIGSQFCIAANKLPLSRCNTFWIALSSFDSPDIIGLDITNSTLVSISPIGFVKENVGGLKATKETNWLAGNSVKAVLKEKIEEVKRGSLVGARSWKVTSTVGGKV